MNGRLPSTDSLARQNSKCSICRLLANSCNRIVDCGRVLRRAWLMQPLVTVDCQVMCFFLCSDEDTNLNFVVFVC